jgi:hypothetical protein
VLWREDQVQEVVLMLKLFPGLVLSAVEATAVFVTAQAKVPADLVAYFDSLVCEFCNDRGLVFEGPHSGGCYTVRACSFCAPQEEGRWQVQQSQLQMCSPECESVTPGCCKFPQ